MLTHRAAMPHFDWRKIGGALPNSAGAPYVSGKKNKEWREKKGLPTQVCRDSMRECMQREKNKIYTDNVKVIKYVEMTHELMLMAGGSNFTVLH